MATAVQRTAVQTTAPRPALATVADLVTRGAVAGLLGGLVFAVANMYFAVTHGKPSVAPFLAISTIFQATESPTMDAQSVITGLVLHLGLSMLFGVAFALLVASWVRKPLLLVLGSLVFGVVLYLVNFQVVARLFFPFFLNPMGPNQTFELWIHPVAYGLVLVPFLLGRTRA